MKNLTIFFIFLTIFSLVYGREICYIGLGCFTDANPFSGTLARPVAVLPDTPERIATKFKLYNKVKTSGEIIAFNKTGTSFDPSLKTKLIIHGFLHHSIKKWVIEMKDEILKVDDVNVITVDWSKGNGFPYTQATANTQVVGAEIARLINTLIENFGAKAADFHLIGHSLGSHISGYVGSRIKGLGRITGLDPAGPYFENTDPIVRLDPTDALFVDAIHTDGSSTLSLGLGLFQMVGHADFYPNGGYNQPLCPQTSGKIISAIFNVAILNLEGIDESTACSHSAALHFFTDSIKNKCKYTAFLCKNKEDFDAGKCISCSSKGCNRMGYWASSSNDGGMLFLNTQPSTQETFCKPSFLVRLFSDNKNELNQARGLFSIYLQTKDRNSSVSVIDNSMITFKPNTEQIKLFSLEEPIEGEILSAHISYKKTSNLISSWLYDSKWSFKYIEIINGDDQKSFGFCQSEDFIQSGSTVKFLKC